MINKKFVRIANVGRFSKLSPDGDVELKEITLIYAENGYGKTTIAGLIRSLKTGEAAYLSERATLGATGKQGVDLLLGDVLGGRAGRKLQQRAGVVDVLATDLIGDQASLAG